MGVTTRHHPRAVALAERMGRRAGEQLRDLGVPSPLPAPFRRRDELAAAWRRGYGAGLAGRRR